MKRQILTVCLLASLAGAGRAEAAPIAETPPVPPSPPSKVRQPELEARRQALEARRGELEAEFQELETEMAAQAKEMDPEGRLTSDQLFELLQTRERRLDRDHFDPVPAIISMSFFGCTLTAFLAWLYASYRRARQIHETVRMMVEKGAEIPQGLLAPPPKRKPSDLRRGIILSTAGLGLAIFLGALPNAEGAWGVGVTLLLIGLGHLIVWRLQQGKGPLSSALSPEPQL
ncbi:DUF6249 domain-containing protein [Vitiosangium sp. GDMCC 1.1324]|uniref:DUF6249 domain-containing protein n=1 Tax=Vitiosangium sp. (strain GDMCC 1.1324) TaxID=2138576 RepID=UPI000D3AF7A2|nr:DUF6249 domain-containing protein [Vitiosangium sp. GDMCC 1.1324]PTL80605.1 hypothetical protein DAT35_28675 [Vitiosangium sp. GDMCC 1.1324]